MPVISFADLDRQSRQNAQDRAVTEPGTSSNPNATVVAADHLATTGTKPGAIAGFNSSAFDSAKMRGPNAGHQPGNIRVGTVITTDLWIQENKALQLHAGPKDVSWTFPMRVSDVETKAGHARFAQNRSLENGDEAYFGFPTANFTFQSGNIMPIQTFQSEVQLAHGLKDFYMFSELLNQPPLIPSGENEGAHNYTWIFYTSLVYPQITLKGYFSREGISWTDDSGAPSSIDWGASFKVHDMSPNFFNSGELESSYLDFMVDSAKLF